MGSLILLARLHDRQDTRYVGHLILLTTLDIFRGPPLGESSRGCRTYETTHDPGLAAQSSGMV